jgi:hypothetical protein
MEKMLHIVFQEYSQSTNYKKDLIRYMVQEKSVVFELDSNLCLFMKWINIYKNVQNKLRKLPEKIMIL